MSNTVKVVYTDTELSFDQTDYNDFNFSDNFLVVLCGELLTSKVYYKENNVWAVKYLGRGNDYGFYTDEAGYLVLHVDGMATDVEAPINIADVKALFTQNGVDWSILSSEFVNLKDEDHLPTDENIVEWLLSECFHFTGDAYSSQLPANDFVHGHDYMSKALIVSLLGCEKDLYRGVYSPQTGFDLDLAVERLEHLRHRKQNLSKEPIGTVVTGRFKEFDLPIPDNLHPVDGSRCYNILAHPNIYGKTMNTWTGRVIACENPNSSSFKAGTYAGTNTTYISKSNLPTDNFTMSGFMDGYIDGRLPLTWSDSYNGDARIYTNTNSHSHRMYGDSASDVRSSSGGSGSDLVLNNNDGRQRADYWWTDSSSHSHYITGNQIMSKLAADLDNKFVRVSGDVSGKLNTSRSGIENRQQTMYAEMYMVVY